MPHDDDFLFGKPSAACRSALAATRLAILALVACLTLMALLVVESHAETPAANPPQAAVAETAPAEAMPLGMARAVLRLIDGGAGSGAARAEGPDGPAATRSASVSSSFSWLLALPVAILALALARGQRRHAPTRADRASPPRS